MPWFRFIGEARTALRFRDGLVLLDFASLQGTVHDTVKGVNDPGVWAWVARRESDPESYVILIRRGNMMALHNDLVKNGFEVEAGSPAHRIMAAAVRLRKAEDLPAEERWRREIISARR